MRSILAGYLREQRVARRWRIALFFLRTTAFFGFIFLLSGVFFVEQAQDSADQSKKHLALISISGVIADGAFSSATRINKALDTAFNNKQAQAIVLEINSPGGSPTQAALVYDRIMSLREEYPNKKVFAVIADVGTSAAYHIATAAHDIYANRNSVVGSIGVVMFHLGYQDLLQKIGVESRVKHAGQYKDIGNPARKETLFEKRFLEGMLARLHSNFIADIKKGRGDRLQGDTKYIFSGLFWEGKVAKDMGLIDRLEGIEYIKKEVIGIDRLVRYDEQDKWNELLDKIRQWSSVDIASFHTNPILR